MKFATAAIAATVGLLSAPCLASPFRNYKEGDDIEEIVGSHEYNLVSLLKPSEPESVEINELLDGAAEFFKLKTESGEWPMRSVGWTRIDIEQFPQYALDDKKSSLQLMAANDGRGTRKNLGLMKHYEDKVRNHELFASIVRELSGEWITEIKCDDIQKDGRRFFDEVIYFGPKKDLDKDGQAELINDLALIDTYRFQDSRVSFHYNEDRKCRSEFNLDPKKAHIAFLSGDATPNILTVNEDYIDLKQMLFTLNTSILKGTPQWGQRAYSTLFDLGQNAIIYYMPDGETVKSIR